MAERTAEWVASPAPAPVGEAHVERVASPDPPVGEAHAEWVAEAGLGRRKENRIVPEPIAETSPGGGRQITLVADPPPEPGWHLFGPAPEPPPADMHLVMEPEAG